MLTMSKPQPCPAPLQDSFREPHVHPQMLKSLMSHTLCLRMVHVNILSGYDYHPRSGWGQG